MNQLPGYAIGGGAGGAKARSRKRGRLSLAREALAAVDDAVSFPQIAPPDVSTMVSLNPTSYTLRMIVVSLTKRPQV